MEGIGISPEENIGKETEANKHNYLNFAARDREELEKNNAEMRKTLREEREHTFAEHAKHVEAARKNLEAERIKRLGTDKPPFSEPINVGDTRDANDVRERDSESPIHHNSAEVK